MCLVAIEFCEEEKKNESSISNVEFVIEFINGQFKIYASTQMHSDYHINWAMLYTVHDIDKQLLSYELA